MVVGVSGGGFSTAGGEDAGEAEEEDEDEEAAATLAGVLAAGIRGFALLGLAGPLLAFPGLLPPPIPTQPCAFEKPEELLVFLMQQIPGQWRPVRGQGGGGG